MGISKWFRRSTPVLPRLEHPIFGEIQATIDVGGGLYFWETPESLVTAKGPIGIFFDAPAEGPSVQQVEMWDWVYRNSESLTWTAEPEFRSRMAELGIEHRFSELVWSAVGLSKDGDPAKRWDMSFELADGAILTTYFSDGVPVSVSFDD